MPLSCYFYFPSMPCADLCVIENVSYFTSCVYRAQTFGEIRMSLIRERSGQTGMPVVCTCMYMYLRTESYLRPWIIEFPSVRLDFSTTTRSQRTATLVSENKRVREDTVVIVASTSPGLVYNVSRLRHARVHREYVHSVHRVTRTYAISGREAR